MTERFKPDWFFMGGGHCLHWVNALSGGRISACGILANKDRIYQGHSTMKCKRCLKAMNGREK